MSGPRAALVGLVYALVALAACSPIFFSEPNAMGVNDWDQHFSHIEAARRTVVDSEQWPFWNPYQCGGVELLASPSSVILSPVFLAVLILGTLPGMKIMIFLHLWLGLLGMHRVAERYALAGAALFVPPVVFMLSAIYALHVTAGAVEWLAMGWLPWVVWWVMRQTDEAGPAPVVGAGLCLAAAFLGGGNFFVIYIFLVGAGLALTRAIQRRSIGPLFRLGLTGLLAAGLAAPKLLAGLLLEARFPRTVPLHGFRELDPARLVEGGIAGTLELLYRVFADRDQTGLTATHQVFWVEYGAYVGWLALALALVGCVALARKHPELIVMPALFVPVGLGSWSPIDLWSLLTSVPITRNLNHPPRLFAVVTFFLAIAAGAGLHRLVSAQERWAAGREKLFHAVALLVPLVLAADYVSVDRKIWSHAFIAPPVEAVAAGDFHQRMQARSMFTALAANVGVIDAYNHSGRPRNALAATSPAYRGEVFLESGRGDVAWESFSPGVLRIRHDAEQGDRVVINQNAAAGWRVARGTGELVPGARLLTVAVPPGPGSFELRYTAPGFGVGFLLLVLTGLSSTVWVLGRPGVAIARIALASSLVLVVATFVFYYTAPARDPAPAQNELRAAREASFHEAHHEAVSAWEIVVREYPDFYRARLTLARELLEVEQVERGREELERAVLLAPGDPEAHRLLLAAGAAAYGDETPPTSIAEQALRAARYYASTEIPVVGVILLQHVIVPGFSEREMLWRDESLSSLLEHEHADRILGRARMDWLRRARQADGP